ncbi:SMP-30/gluconolactonase/LRE family protein [Pseudanabaena yagii]|uniref:Gluconolactonase n=1 Tax=Pseudanabaena yagii GIHE-NHR1 TaxID=2722753 RepID=A0ABX1LWP1_9CYAN|nr:gluconolactonase [Pseudanabaena yagii]NMF59411.1 gluconolactonase [Pseudanabaena yagii GIHE-NHR1]
MIETLTDLLPAQAIAEFPVNTFLESIVVDADNTLFITSHYEGKVFRISTDGVVATHATIAGKATGLALTPNGELLLSGWDEKETSVVWLIASDGTVELLTELPEAIFLNGLTGLDGDNYLIADSYRGAIWQLNVPTKTVSIWLEHADIARTSPEEVFPAVNGLKIYDNFLYASNTQKQQIVKIPILADRLAGEPEIFLSGINIDDFAFDIEGNLYGTTHVFNSVVKIAPDGTVTTIAQLEQGMAGSTALAFGTSEGDRTSIYVTTNGGMSFPPATGVESGKVVRLEVGIAGLPLV